MWQFADLQFADHIYFLELRSCDLQSCDLQICDLQAQLTFADLQLPQICKYIVFILTNICLNCHNSNLRITFGFQNSFELYCIPQNKIFLRRYRKYQRQNSLDLDRKHCFFSCKFADLRFVDWDTKDICGFAVCGMSPRICGFTKMRFAEICLPTFDCKIYIHKYALYTTYTYEY